ncbi:MAG: hypothetical protein Q8K92_17900, partial [Leadbetterella sp.]|nr:hypothetical protein [Leadbetterella sp.]
LWLAAESGNKPWILVKAISDWGDGKKRDSDTEQYIAAAAAADLVNFVLSKKSALKGCRK